MGVWKLCLEKVCSWAARPTGSPATGQVFIGGGVRRCSVAAPQEDRDCLEKVCSWAARPTGPPCLGGKFSGL